MLDLVRADAEGGGVPHDRLGGGGVRAAVEQDLGGDEDQGPVPPCAVRVAHDRGVAMYVPEEGFLPVVRHLHRPSGTQREHRRVDLHGQVLAAAERAADAGQRHPDQVRGQAEAGSDLVEVRVQPLGRDV